MLTKNNTNQSSTCPRCGLSGKFKEVQKRTYFPPMTKQKIIARLTRCPHCNEMVGTVSKIQPSKESGEDV